MSVSAANLYKVGKSPDQLMEDKAVQIFFRKQLQATKESKKKYNNESSFDDRLDNQKSTPTLNLHKAIDKLEMENKHM